MKAHVRVLEELPGAGFAAALPIGARVVGGDREKEGGAAGPADEDLVVIRRMQNGDDEALNELMERYGTPLFRFVWRFTGNESDAADLVQETFVRVYLNRARFEPRGKVRTWIYTIAKNLCRDWARSRKRKPLVLMSEILDREMLPGGFTDMPRTETASPREKAAYQEEACELRAAIDRLPEKLRSALILFCLEEHSQEEVADLLGCTAKAVEARVYRAKKILKKYMGGSRR